MTDPEIQKIIDRNARVERDKKWETSLARRVVLTVVTWGAAFGFLKIIHADNAALAALVPAGGFLLSTLRLPWARTIWEKFQK